MPSELQRVAGELLACIDRIPDVANYLLRTARSCREQAAFLDSFRSSNPAVARAAQQLDAAARACEEAAEFAGRVPPRARGWVEQMVSGGRTATKPGGAAKAADPKRHTEIVADIMRRLPKRNPANSDPTTGIFIDDDGKQIDFVSGRGDFLERQGLDLCRARGWPAYDRTRHTELKFAVYMRLHGLNRATLYLNNLPCNRPGANCRNLLPQFLPPGAELVIYGPDDYEETFRGE
jgi:hypothetical protein